MFSVCGSQQLIAGGWIGWLRSRRAALLELAAAALGPTDGYESSIVADSRDSRGTRAPAPPYLEHIATSYRAFCVGYGAPISAEPTAALAGHGLPAIPVDPGLLVGLASQRVAFKQSPSAALGTGHSAFEHPSMAKADVAAQRSAAAHALRRLGQLERPGMPGATALAASLTISNRDAFFSDAVLSTRISVEDQLASYRWVCSLSARVWRNSCGNWRYWPPNAQGLHARILWHVHGTPVHVLSVTWQHCQLHALPFFSSSSRL